MYCLLIRPYHTNSNPMDIERSKRIVQQQVQGFCAATFSPSGFIANDNAQVSCPPEVKHPEKATLAYDLVVFFEHNDKPDPTSGGPTICLADRGGFDSELSLPVTNCDFSRRLPTGQSPGQLQHGLARFLIHCFLDKENTRVT
jgi:hypothetical protein